MSASYVYCLVQNPDPPRQDELPRGLPDTGPVRFLPLELGLWLVVADAPESHYSAARVSGGMRDLDWVSKCALGHEQVVERFLECDATIPMRLFTLFESDERALNGMRRRRASIQRSLARVARRQEWGLRVQSGPPVTVPSAMPSPSGGELSGRSFLERKRCALAARQSAWQEARGSAESAYGSLSRVAVESRRRDEPGEHLRPVLLDAVFLVVKARREQFRVLADDAARQLRALGCEVAATGPWPPYNFAG